MAVRRIVVVGDDPEVHEALADAMSDACAEVVVAADVVDALALLCSGPRVILLDLRLPRLGGDELLRVMRADPRLEHVPVITMTAGGGAAEDPDVVARLHKPLDLADLRAIVLSLFEAAA